MQFCFTFLQFLDLGSKTSPLLQPAPPAEDTKLWRSKPAENAVVCIRINYGVPNWNAKIKNSNLKTTAFQISVRIRPLYSGTPGYACNWRITYRNAGVFARARPSVGIFTELHMKFCEDSQLWGPKWHFQLATVKILHSCKPNNYECPNTEH